MENSKMKNTTDAEKATGRTLRADSARLVNWVSALIALLVVAAGILSFNGQAELARRGGISAEIVWLWPILIDGVVIVGTFAALILTPRGRAKSLYAWGVVLLFSGITVFANALHGIDGALATPIRVLITASPALGVVLMVHLLVIIKTSPEVIVEQVVVKKQIVEVPIETVTSPPAPPVAPAPGSEERHPTPRTSRRGALDAAASVAEDEETVKAWILDQVRTTGKCPSAQAIGDKLGRSRPTGSRLRKQLAETEPEVAAALGRQLHLVAVSGS